MNKRKHHKKLNSPQTAKVLLNFALANLIVSSIFTLTACGNNKSESTRAETETPIFYREEDDPELAMATARARTSFSTFRNAFNAKKEGDTTDFQIKFPTTVADTTEFFWMNVTSLDGDKVSGTYDSDGTDIPSIHKNDPVSVSVGKITDWLIDNGSTAKGGFSMPLFEKFSIEQLNDIDSSSPEKAAKGKQKLLAHWRDLEAQAKSHRPIKMYKVDFETLQRIRHVQRLHKGNTGTEASVKEIAKIYDMPEELIQATENFYVSWQNSIKKGDAPPNK